MTRASRFDPVVVADAAEALRAQIDVLLDRSADRLLCAPPAGTIAWHAAWQIRDSATGRARAQAHRIARIAVAQRLGLDIRTDVNAARAAGATTREIEAALAADIGRRWPRRPTPEGQLFLFT